jgi:hypothetical protein
VLVHDVRHRSSILKGDNPMTSQISRRSMIKQAAAGGAIAVFGSHHHASAAPTAKVESIDVISLQPHLYHGWPTITRRRNGQLWLVWSGGRESHVCPFGRVESIVSNDDGRTWSWPRVLLDGVIDDRDAGVLETAQGTLLVTTFSSMAYEEYFTAKASDWPVDKRRRWKAARARLPLEQRHELTGSWMLRSVDGGLTWSAPYDCLVNSPHGPVQLSDGRLLYAGKNIGNMEPQKAFTGFCESKDDGQSWNRLAELPTRKGDDSAKYHELHAVETANGRIIAQIRNHNAANHYETLQTESTDGGESWSVPHSIGVWGYPSHLLKLKDGRLLMSYGHRRPPIGNQARVSEDNGNTWSAAITISDDATSSDLGYPSTVQLGDGSLLTVWYEQMKGSPMAVLRQARWRLS